jgi:hypothetical protein
MIKDDLTDEEFDHLVSDFFTNLSLQQEPLGPEFEQVLQDNYWDLIQLSNKDK